jgi:hypothetical protein
MLAVLALLVQACGAREETQGIQSQTGSARFGASNEYLLIVDLAGTEFYCETDVSSALDRAIEIMERGGKRFERLPPGDHYGRPADTRFVHLQLTATGSPDAPSCSIAATLTFARLETADAGGGAVSRLIHSTPGTTFIEPEHSGDQAALTQEFVTYLLVIDELASREDLAALRP